MAARVPMATLGQAELSPNPNPNPNPNPDSDPNPNPNPHPHPNQVRALALPFTRAHANLAHGKGVEGNLLGEGMITGG